jgi:hypothetical protein
VIFLSLNPLLEFHNMYYEPFCYRKSAEKIFSSHKLTVSFGVSRVENIPAILGVSLPRGWIHEIKRMYPALLMHGLFLT